MVAAGRVVSLDADQRIILRAITWTEYEIMLAIRGDRAGVRMFYRDGELELMSPSGRHEWIKKAMARMIEAYADATGLELEGYGSMTMRSAPKERGAEPDECYVIGRNRADDRADIAIEVVWTSGGLDKLDIYEGLGIREVWRWEEGHIEVHALRENSYELIPASELIPDLDLARIAKCLELPTQSEAVRAFRESLERKPRRAKKPSSSKVRRPR